MSNLYTLLKDIVEKVNDGVKLSKSLSSIAGIHITTNNKSITLSLKGEGKVKLMTEYDYYFLDANNQDMTSITVDTPLGYLYMSEITNISELDIHGQGVTNFIVTCNCNLNKLAIYDNALTQLDLSNCPHLQFLHIQNNPICDNDDYKDNLISCVNSLPDRRLNATGSIILYPWYGLEVLICNDDKGNYIKYPVGWSKLTLEDGRLYGVVSNDIITYHTYRNNLLVPHDAMNRHHTLRKELEDISCLQKNWVFGSAIMYSDDWKYCTWDFRKNNIADMWETAEKGFGLTWGCSDAFTNTLPGFKYLNIKDMRRFGAWDYTVDTLPKALDYTSENDWSWCIDNPNNPYTLYKAGKRLHGDAILSIVLGTQWCEDEVSRRFGYTPNACAALNDTMTVSGNSLVQLDAFDTTMQYLANNSDTLSFSFGLRDSHERIDMAKTVLGKYGVDHVVTISSGNNGDGLPYTTDPSPESSYYGNYSNYAGDYEDVDESGNLVIKPTSTIYVGSCGPSFDISPFSNASVDTKLQDNDRSTYLTAFGDQIFVWNNYLKCLKCGAGTSYAAPICSATLLLLRNIYSKMFKSETSFGKHSNFMTHVRNRWCIHNDTNMDIAEGYGVPNIFATPYSPKLLKNDGDDWEPTLHYDKEVPIGNSISLDYIVKNPRNKSRYTVEPKLSNIAINDTNDVYPLIPMNDVVVKVFSNSSLENPIDLNENYHISELSLSAIETDIQGVSDSVPLFEHTLTTNFCEESVIVASTDYSDCDEFTVQFALDFTDKLYPVDNGQYTTSRDLFYFYNGDELGRFYVNKITYNRGDKYITLNDDTMLHHRYFSDVQGRNRNLIETQSVGFGIQNKLDFNILPYAIITVTVSKDWITYYLNGTYMGRIIKVPGDSIKLSNIYINQQSLCHDSVNCVRMYDRVLSDKEIIHNTIYMLNKHFDEETE